MRIDKLFDSNSDCYTQVDKGNGSLQDEPAISKSKFIKVIWDLIPSDKDMDRMIEDYVSQFGKGLGPVEKEITRSNAKKHFEKGIQAAIKAICENCG